jgi:predicted transcriptional regulator
MRRQFVLDERTDRLLAELAADRAGNRSHVVREAIQLYADVQQRLDDFEENPQFEEMIKRSAEDIRAGRVVSHEEAKRRARRRRS